MGCDNIRTNIPLLLAEELSPDECHKLLNHMEGCIGCRQEMEELRKAWELMDHWSIEEPSPGVKYRLMAAARVELQGVHVPWWANLWRSFIFPTVVGALGLSMIIYLLFPYDKVISLCETNILNGGLLASLPKGLVYFVLGLLYGLVPLSISGIFFSKCAGENPMARGLGAGSIFAAFLVPFFIVQCPEFASGLISIMALGIIAGSLSGITGTLWVLSRVRMEVS